MKRLLLLPLLLLIPSAQAVDYVKCEAIQKFAREQNLLRSNEYQTAVMTITRENEIPSKIHKKYGTSTCKYAGSSKSLDEFLATRKECKNFKNQLILSLGGEEEMKKINKKYNPRIERAKKDFKKAGCYGDIL